MIEDGAAIAGLVFFSSASNSAITGANSALCAHALASPNITQDGGAASIMSCIAVLPEGSSSVETSFLYWKRCSRNIPHMYLNLELVGIAESELRNGVEEETAAAAVLRAGIASAAGVVTEAVSIDVVEESLSRRRTDRGAVGEWNGEDMKGAHEFSASWYRNELELKSVGRR